MWEHGQGSRHTFCAWPGCMERAGGKRQARLGLAQGQTMARWLWRQGRRGAGAGGEP